jgi:hypothetical protein
MAADGLEENPISRPVYRKQLADALGALPGTQQPDDRGSADRLGDDVLNVIDALKLMRPYWQDIPSAVRS